jgi:hypothetical protein
MTKPTIVRQLNHTLNPQPKPQKKAMLWPPIIEPRADPDTGQYQAQLKTVSNWVTTKSATELGFSKAMNKFIIVDIKNELVSFSSDILNNIIYLWIFTTVNKLIFPIKKNKLLLYLVATKNKYMFEFDQYLGF